MRSGVRRAVTKCFYSPPQWHLAIVARSHNVNKQTPLCICVRVPSAMAPTGLIKYSWRNQYKQGDRMGALSFSYFFPCLFQLRHKYFIKLCTNSPNVTHCWSIKGPFFFLFFLIRPSNFFFWFTHIFYTANNEATKCITCGSLASSFSSCPAAVV